MNDALLFGAMVPGAMEVLGYLCLLLFLACSGFGAIVGGQKDAAFAGFLLGLVLGPLGVLVTCFLDFRPQCPVCGGRIDKGYRKCSHCGAGLDWHVSGVPPTPEHAQMQEARLTDEAKPVETQPRKPGKTLGQRVRSVAVSLGRKIVNTPRRTDLMLRALAGEDNAILYGFLRCLLIGLISFVAAVVFVVLYVVFE